MQLGTGLGLTQKFHSPAATVRPIQSVSPTIVIVSDKSTCTLTSFSNRGCSISMQLWQMLVHKRGNVLSKN